MDLSSTWMRLITAVDTCSRQQEDGVQKFAELIPPLVGEQFAAVAIWMAIVSTAKEKGLWLISRHELEPGSPALDDEVILTQCQEAIDFQRSIVAEEGSDGGLLLTLPLCCGPAALGAICLRLAVDGEAAEAMDAASESLVRYLGYALWALEEHQARQRLAREFDEARKNFDRRYEALKTTADDLVGELDTMVEELTRSNQDLEQFAYAASHDLQEPLRKVMAFGSRLRDSYGDVLDEKGRDYLRRMEGASRRMQALINDLLAYSRVTTQPRPFEAVDLNAVIRGVLADLEIRLQESKGRVDVDPLPTVEADPNQMRQLFHNLINNALKFRKPDAQPVVRVTSEVNETGCRLIFADNGIGFDNQYRTRIFGVFKRLHGRHSNYEGTGIGLALCQKIVARHQGAIQASGVVNEGATFTVELPLTQRG